MTIAIQAPRRERRQFPAQLSALPEAVAFAQDFCARQRVAQPAALRLALAIEELFTNTVGHGHGGDSKVAMIVVGLSVTATRVRLGYADAAPRFDPRPWLASPPVSLGAAAAARPVGGLGLHIIGRLASRFRYAYRGGNRLAMAFAIEEDGAPVP